MYPHGRVYWVTAEKGTRKTRRGLIVVGDSRIFARGESPNSPVEFITSEYGRFSRGRAVRERDDERGGARTKIWKNTIRVDDVDRSEPPRGSSPAGPGLPLRSLPRIGPAGSVSRVAPDGEEFEGRDRAIKFTWSAISSALENTSCEITIVAHRLSKTENVYPCTHRRTHVRARKWHGGAARAKRRPRTGVVGVPPGGIRSRPRECDVEIGCARNASGVRGRRTRLRAVRRSNSIRSARTVNRDVRYGIFPPVFLSAERGI